MIDIELDPTTNDLVLDSFDLSLIKDVRQVAQNLAIRLRFFLGEWYLDTTVGLPYYEYILVKNPNQIQVESFIKEEIAATQGIEQITAFSSSFDIVKRIYSVAFSVKTLNDNLQLELEIP
jgi:hypothetical protein